MPEFDVIVIGLGAMGSATTYQLAQAGAKVLGIDRYDPPHALGSSHGDTRFTRLATGEGAEYAPLAIRSHQLWRDIERQTGYELLTQCGGLIMTTPEATDPLHAESDFIQRTVAVAQRYQIPYDQLSTPALAKRFPQFVLTRTEKGYFEPGAGFVRPENCVRAQLELAQKLGASLHTSERVMSYESAGGSVTVSTDKATYQAKQLVVCAGSWVNELFPGHEDIFTVYRQALYWFDLKDAASYERYKTMPVYAWASEGGFFYGFPPVDGLEGGIKVATEQYGHATNPTALNRTVTEQEIAGMYNLIKDRLPGISQKCLRAEACMYTVTPDSKFVIDFHPQHRNVIVVSPCSGHGFKHSAAIGEAVAQLVQAGTSAIDLGAFRLS